MSERFADGLVSEEELLQVYESRVPRPVPDMASREAQVWAAAFATAHWDARGVADLASANAILLDMGRRPEETHEQANLYRHILGNPFSPPSPPSLWPSSIPDLALRMYEGDEVRTQLQEALTIAGYPELAGHFSSPEHPKGCWVLDMILAKS